MFKDKIKEAEGKNRVLHYILDIYRCIRKHIIDFMTNIRLRGMSRKEAFQDIYKNDRWGYKRYENAPLDFYSGPGSYAVELVNPYVSLIEKLVSEKGIKTIVDLGCGDFNIGSKIAPFVTDYTGCDIVPELIVRNQKQYGNDKCRFVCLDMVDDDIPAADLCLIREVLQHLSNKEVMQVLPKLCKYKYVLITGTIKTNEERINNEIPHGSYRGVYLENPPFCMKGTEVLRVDHPSEDDAIVVSTLYDHSTL